MVRAPEPAPGHQGPGNQWLRRPRPDSPSRRGDGRAPAPADRYTVRSVDGRARSRRHRFATTLFPRRPSEWCGQPSPRPLLRTNSSERSAARRHRLPHRRRAADPVGILRCRRRATPRPRPRPLRRRSVGGGGRPAGRAADAALAASRNEPRPPRLGCERSRCRRSRSTIRATATVHRRSRRVRRPRAGSPKRQSSPMLLLRRNTQLPMGSTPRSVPEDTTGVTVYS